MRKLVRSVALAAALGLAATPASAQTLFTGSGCSGNTFQFCASWTGTYVDATHFSLFFTNTSTNANSAFTQIAIGNVTVADPASMASVTGWQYDPNVNGFNGFGLLQNQFGSITTNGINNALLMGGSLTFAFTFGSSIGTYAQALAAFSGTQLAIHDQGSPSGTTCPSSKGVLDGDTSGGLTGTLNGCATSTTPEPSTYVLMATGLVGIFGLARRRRSAIAA
jgi:hypothetical protein